MSDEGMSDEMLAVVRKDISSSGDFGEVAAHVAAALIARLDAAEARATAAEEREAVALAMLNGKRLREGWPITASIPEGFADGDEWRLEAQDALSALAPIRAAEILAAEARGAERERASKGTVTTYKRGFGPGDGDSAIEHGAGK